MKSDLTNMNKVAVAALAFLLATVLGCGDDGENPAVNGGDAIGPTPVATLSGEPVSSDQALLTWIATGDDSVTGKAHDYDVRRSLCLPSRENWWDSLTVAIPDTLEPKIPGEKESLVVFDLLPDTTYYFGLVVLDEEGNRSALSNTPSVRTPPETSSDLRISPDTLRFGGTEVESVFLVSNGGDGEISWTLATVGDWIAVSPAAGATAAETDTVTVTVDREGLEPGLHSGKVIVAPGEGSPAEVAVEMTVSSSLITSVWAIDFGKTTAESSFTISNGGSGRVTWTIADDRDWISAAPESGGTAEETDTISVFVNREGMSGGTYSGTVTITPDCGEPSPVAIHMAVLMDPILEIDHSNLYLGRQAIESRFVITNAGDGVLSWTIDDNEEWIDIDPAEGTTATERDTIQVTVDRSGLTPGEYSGMVTVTPDSGDPVEVTVHITVTADHCLELNPSEFYFGRYANDSIFTITNLTEDSLAWSISTDCGWLDVVPMSGTTSTEMDTILVTIDPSGMDVGNYSGKVLFDPSAGPRQEIAVALRVFPEFGQMVLVPGGSYIMGDGASNCGVDEREIHLTNDFYLGNCEVTHLEYRDALQWAYDNGYVTASPSTVRDNLDGGSDELVDLDYPTCQISFSGGTFSIDPGKEDRPAIHVTWRGAAAYCDWLNLQEGYARAYDHSTWECNGGDPYGAAGYRLPTDAEWEYAAQYDDERPYPWGSEGPDCSRAQYLPCQSPERAGRMPVGSFAAAPAALGLYDMAGNLYEWCNDRYQCSLGTDPETNPPGPASGQYRVLRGGSWYHFGGALRVSERYFAHPGHSTFDWGFRIARTY